LQEILSRDDLVLPENVERVNTKSHAGEKSGKQRRTKGPRGDKVRD